MTKNEKFMFYEVLLTEKSFDRAVIKLDLAGVHLQKELYAWLKSYYNAKEGNGSLPSLDAAIEIIDGES